MNRHNTGHVISHRHGSISELPENKLWAKFLDAYYYNVIDTEEAYYKLKDPHVLHAIYDESLEKVREKKKSDKSFGADHARMNNSGENKFTTVTTKTRKIGHKNLGSQVHDEATSNKSIDLKDELSQSKKLRSHYILSHRRILYSNRHNSVYITPSEAIEHEGETKLLEFCLGIFLFCVFYISCMIIYGISQRS